MRLRLPSLLILCAGLMLGGCKPLINFYAFHPNASFQLPQRALPPDTEEIFLQTEDGVRIQALKFDNPSADTVTIFFHGNAGNLYYRLMDYQRLRALGTSVLAVSYRGYGKSEGEPSEQGIYLDGQAAFDYVIREMAVPSSRIFLFGRSLGATVAADLAQGRNIAGLILVTPFNNAGDQASAMGMGFAAPLVAGVFENDKKIKRLNAALLIIHGSEDRIIPMELGRKLYDTAEGEKSFHAIEGAGHNDISQRFSDQYWDKVSNFINRR